MYYLRYWARYVRKGEVKSGGIQIVLCNSFLYTNNIQKYYSISHCIISIIIVIAPTSCLLIISILFDAEASNSLISIASAKVVATTLLQ